VPALSGQKDMSDIHPSQQTQPVGPCWCERPYNRWGCNVHGPEPLPAGQHRNCDACPCVTYNLIGRCDACCLRLDPELFPGTCRLCDRHTRARNGMCVDCAGSIAFWEKEMGR
jgi:hypothetical protein